MASKNNKHNNTKGFKNIDVSPRILVICLVAITAIGAIVVASVLLYRNYKVQRFDNMMTKGNNYLTVMNYDSAITEYLAVLEADETYDLAYIGIANAYKGKANECRKDDIFLAIEYYNTALEWLNKGYEITASEQIQTKINEMTDLLQIAEIQSTAIIEGTPEYYEDLFQKTYSGLYEQLSYIGMINSNHSNFTYMYLTYSERNDAYLPVIDKLSSYIIDLYGMCDIYSEDSFWDSLYINTSLEYDIYNNAIYISGPCAYQILTNLYIYVNELEKAQQIRYKYAELLNNPAIASDNYTIGNIHSNEYSIYNSYGLLTESSEIVTNGTAQGSSIIRYEYNDNLQCTTFFIYSPSYINSDLEWAGYTEKTTTYTYDELGRLTQQQTVLHNIEDDTYTNLSSTYTYNGDNTFTSVYTDDDGETLHESAYTYNEYGNLID